MNNHFFHCVNRGVEKRDIVTNEKDRDRFALSLALLNSSKTVYNMQEKMEDFSLDIGSRVDCLVHVHGWCLMKNHYHLLLSPVVEYGVSRFLQKLNIGYTKYFNVRHERTGVLFQGKTKKVPILDDRHLFYILHYIHANPLDTQPDTHQWRNHAMLNKERAATVLDNYPWSSYRAYTQNINDGITDTTFFNELFNENGDSYKKNFSSFLKERVLENPFSQKELE